MGVTIPASLQFRRFYNGEQGGFGRWLEARSYHWESSALQAPDEAQCGDYRRTSWRRCSRWHPEVDSKGGGTGEKAMSIRSAVLFEQAQHNWAAYVPDLPVVGQFESPSTQALIHSFQRAITITTPKAATTSPTVSVRATASIFEGLPVMNWEDDRRASWDEAPAASKSGGSRSLGGRV